MTETTQKIRPALYGMEVGGTIKFPISRLKSVRTQASELGMMFERHYTTKTNREEKTIEVTRTA